MHYYSHNIGDYKRDTDHLSLLEHGVYRQLMDLYYLSEKPIPLETEWVFRRLAAVTEAEKLAIQAVLKDFFKKTKEGFKHTRCDMEIREYQHKAETARVNGKKGGRPTKTDPVISGMQEKSGSQANHQPLTKNQEPRTKKRKGAKAPMSADKLPTWMKALVDLYHEILPELPGVRVMDAKREQAMRDFWDWVMTTHKPDGTPRATNEAEAIAWTGEYFKRARSNDFIMGRTTRTPGHENWRCSIEFLLSAAGMKKVIEETNAEEQPA